MIDLETLRMHEEIKAMREILLRCSFAALCNLSLSLGVSASLQFFGVIVSWLYITRVEDAISEYGHYMDGLLNSSTAARESKRHGRVAKWFKCMPDID